MSVIKTVSIKGNLLKQPFRYSLCPPEEFSFGLWSIAISSIAYSASQATNIFISCEVSSNFVVAEKFNEQREVETYEQPLASFMIDTTKIKLRTQIFSIMNLQQIGMFLVLSM